MGLKSRFEMKERMNGSLVCLKCRVNQDLMELSGGQKALLSIALILAQVESNPFSLYIFDEVRDWVKKTSRLMLL